MFTCLDCFIIDIRSMFSYKYESFTCLNKRVEFL